MADRDVPPDGVPPAEAALRYFSDRDAADEYVAADERLRRLAAEKRERKPNVVPMRMEFDRTSWLASEPRRHRPITEYERTSQRCSELRHEMRTELIRRLRDGDLVAYGYDSRALFDAPLVRVPTHRWRTLKLNFRKSEATDGDLRISGLLIAPAKATPVQPATIHGEQQCREWLAQQMRAGQRPKTKARFKEEAQARFRVSARGFDRAWNQAIADTGRHDWSRPGRKS